VAGSIEELSFELSSNAMTEQERALSGLRARAGTILAAASIAGAFLGAKTSHGSLDTWSILALVCFIMCLGSSIWLLLPHEFVFALRGRVLLAESDHLGVRDVTEAYRAAALWIEPHLETNRQKIAQLSDWLAVSCALLAAEVIFWTFSLTG
jgi:hypothetical protein